MKVYFQIVVVFNLFPKKFQNSFLELAANLPAASR